MGRKKEQNVIGDVELLILMLEKEWSYSKEPEWRVEVPYRILKAVNKEVDAMSRYIRSLRIKSSDHEELPLFRMVYATKQAHVLIRLAKKVLDASKEALDKETLVLALDEDEYKMMATCFLEFM